MDDTLFDMGRKYAAVMPRDAALRAWGAADVRQEKKIQLYSTVY